MCRRCDYAQRTGTPISLPFFEITLVDGHLVRDMGKAQDRLPACPRKRVKPGRFHLDGEDVAGATALYGRSGLAERRISCPTGAASDALPGCRQCISCRVDKPLIGRRELRRRKIVIARALVPQGALNQDEVRGWCVFHDLPGGSHADQEATA